MSIKPYAKPYNIMQYIRDDEFVTLSELSEKTNTGVPTIKKQLAKLREALSNTGYKISSCNKGIKLIKGDSDYLPVDLIFFNSQEFDFITIYLQFIINGLSDYSIFRKMYTAKFYTDRQLMYFFETNLNISFSDFKKKSNFEHFSLFVEYCVLWCSCKNIRKLFNEYLHVNDFNNNLLSYPKYKDISANDYMTIYSSLVFEKINIVEMSTEYNLLLAYFKCNRFLDGLKYYNHTVCFTQNYVPSSVMYDEYCRTNGISKLNKTLDVLYKDFEMISYELEHLQKTRVTRIISYDQFKLTLVCEGSFLHLSLIKGSLKKNYPNMDLECVPSWIYLYVSKTYYGYIFSNAIIDENICVLKPRDQENNYSITFTG